MRILLILLALLAAVLGTVWIGGESLLAARLAQAVESDPRIEAAAVVPLRQPSRIGVRLDAPAFRGPAGSIALPSLDLWAAPYLPQDVRATLPETAALDIGGRSLDAALAGAGGHVRVSPVNGLAVSAAGLDSGPVTLNGVPVLDGLAVEAALDRLGSQAPRTARAAYDIDLRVERVDLAALSALGLTPPLPQGAVPGPVSAAGRLRAYLTEAPGRGAWRTRQPDPILLVGLATDALHLSLGDLAAVLRGRLSQGAGGYAEGRVFVDTADARGFLQAAADAGTIPPLAVTLATGLLTGLSDAAGPRDDGARDDGAQDDGAQDDGGRDDGASIPPPPEGAIRLRFDFREGQVFLAGQPLGPAPAFPAAP